MESESVSKTLNLWIDKHFGTARPKHTIGDFDHPLKLFSTTHTEKHFLKDKKSDSDFYSQMVFKLLKEELEICACSCV